MNVMAPGGLEVRIETKQDEDGWWWGLIYMFELMNEPPLIVGPCEDEASALTRAKQLAKNVAPPDWG